MSASNQIEPAAVVAMIVALKPCAIDEAAIRLALRDTAATSLAEVARAFGVAYSTAKQSWRPAGMPGSSAVRHYPWADTVIWLLKRNTAADQARVASSVYDEGERRELATIQLSTARTDLQLRETKLSHLRGEWVPLAIVQSFFAGLLNVCRDQIMAIPQRIVPMLPARHAHFISSEVQRECANALTALAESDPEDIIRRIHNEPSHRPNGKAHDENGIA